MNCKNDNLKTATAEDLFGKNVPKSSKHSKSSNDNYEPKNQENFGERKRIKP